MYGETMIRTTVFLTKSQHDNLKLIAKADRIGGVKPSHLIRRFVAEGIARSQRQK